MMFPYSSISSSDRIVPVTSFLSVQEEYFWGETIGSGWEVGVSTGTSNFGSQFAHQLQKIGVDTGKVVTFCSFAKPERIFASRVMHDSSKNLEKYNEDNKNNLALVQRGHPRISFV